MYTSNKKGICPVCGHEKLYYQDCKILSSDEGYSDWFCPQCCSKGETWYKIQFTTHSYVWDKNNNFIKEKE